MPTVNSEIISTPAISIGAEYARCDGQHAQQYSCDSRDITRNTDKLVHARPSPNIGAPPVRLSLRVLFASAFRRRRILNAANANSADKTNAPKKQPIANRQTDRQSSVTDHLRPPSRTDHTAAPIVFFVGVATEAMQSLCPNRNAKWIKSLRSETALWRGIPGKGPDTRERHSHTFDRKGPPQAHHLLDVRSVRTDLPI